MRKSFARPGHRPDYFLLTNLVLLAVGGLVILGSASSPLGQRKFGDSYYYLTHQFLYGFSLGLVGFFVAYLVPYRHLKKIAFPFLLLSIVALALVFTKYGIVAGGASRWLRVGPLSFQPAEVVKLSFVLYLAAWLTNKQRDRARSFEGGFVPFLIVSGIITGLLMIQPATSTVVILMGTALIIYYLSDAKWTYIVGVALLGVALLAAVIYATPYRRARITGYLAGGSDTQGINYQREQARIAIGSGGLLGVGYGGSTSKVNLLPGPIDDSIFAVAAQELGFVGGSVLIVLFALLVFRTFWLASKVRDQFGKLILVGFASLVALQSFVNIAAISGLIPVTGVPLPFVSYGGTALAVFLTMGGIAVNVSKYA